MKSISDTVERLELQDTAHSIGKSDKSTASASLFFKKIMR